jgi:hypothetical protein
MSTTTDAMRIRERSGRRARARRRARDFVDERAVDVGCGDARDDESDDEDEDEECVVIGLGIGIGVSTSSDRDDDDDDDDRAFRERTTRDGDGGAIGGVDVYRCV